MDKIKLSLCVFCVLALLHPNAATAMPKVEITGHVTDVSGLPEVISIALTSGQVFEVQLVEFTEIVDVDLSISVGTSININGFSVGGGVIAREIGPGDPDSNSLRGIITSINVLDREVVLFGVSIPVTLETVIKDVGGNKIELEKLGAESLGAMSVKAEGDIANDGEGDYFYITTIKEVAEFGCLSNQLHRQVVTPEEGDTTKKIREEYCELKNGKRTGLTQITESEYLDMSTITNYTVGKYDNQGVRHGFWLTISATGEIVRQCLYHKGTLEDGDLSCPT